MGGLRIWLCGGLRVEVDGVRVDDRLTRRKSRELLALMVDGARPMRREELIELLWPGEPSGAREAALRQLLTEVRSCIGAEAVEGRDPIALALPDETWVDVQVAERQAQAAREAFAARRPDDAGELAAEAVDLVASGFWTGEESDWADQRSRELEELRIGTLELLASARLGQPNREGEAEAAARQLVELAPLREAGYSLLMRAQAAMGNVAEAVRTYERLRSVLREELGTTPSVKMGALHMWVLAQTDSSGPDTETEPATGYARREDGLKIAYQVMGDAAVDLVIVPGFMSHLDLQWADPAYRRFLRALAAFARVITLDKSGTGTSDPIDGALSLEEWAKDLDPVLDAVGSRGAVLLGASEAGPVTIRYGQDRPKRVRGLILYGALAKVLPEPGYLWEQKERIGAAFARFAEVELSWGEGGMTEFLTPGLAGNEAQRRAWAVFERSTGSPASVERRLQAVLETDVRDLLPQVSLPTLVLHREGDRMVLPCYGHFLAEHIPGARLIELPGSCHPPYLGSPEEVESLIAAVRDFVTEHARGADSATGTSVERF